ncbi:MAG: glycosyltransferase family 1 protein, partial [Thermoproteota archaeon]|nr:glycosyltransferase family 1 protein [Thermoproteota archaeon]
MKRLAKRGYEMTLFTSQFKNCQLNETLDGVDVIRDGNHYTVYRQAERYLKAYKQLY